MLKTLIEFTFDFVRVFFIELVYVGPILAFLILCICFMGYIIGRIEGWSKFDAIYHAFINATTVGYGDLNPTKKPSKMLAVATAFVGIVFTGIVVAIGLHAADQAFNKVYETSKLMYRVED
jgi:voltage-gated potassium channel